MKEYNTGPLDDHTVQLGQWRLSAAGENLYICCTGKPGDIHIKAEHEGFIVDVLDDELDEVKATLAVEYVELVPEKEPLDEDGAFGSTREQFERELQDMSWAELSAWLTTRKVVHSVNHTDAELRAMALTDYDQQMGEE